MNTFSPPSICFFFFFCSFPKPKEEEKKMKMKKWGGVFLLSLLIISVNGSSIFSSLFGKEGKKEGGEKEGMGGGNVEFEKYSKIFPLYWKDSKTCTPKPVVDRYLLMSRRNGGWNNERIILENAIIFAWITNRTLVLPYRLRYDHMHGEETFEKFVDLSYARCFVPIITSDQLPELSGGAINERFGGVDRHKDAMTVDIEFNNAAFAVPSVPTALSGASYDDFLEFEAFRTGRATAWQLSIDDEAFIKHLADTGMEKMSVRQLDNRKRFLNSKNHFFCLFYAFFWFQDKQQHDQMVDIIKHGTHYQEKFWDAASAIMVDIGEPGSFSSIHIRARDFRTKSGYYRYFKSKSWIENFRTHHKNTFNEGEHVYISTDEKNLEEIKEFQRQLEQEFLVKTFTIYDFFDRFNFDQGATNRRWEFWGESKINSGDASQFNLNDLGLIEQIVCGHGRRFVGTYFSTFSAHIIMLRGYMSHSWLVKYEHLFWDRTLENLRKCTWGSVPEDCQPSWQGHFRGAMWASEFEEGWSTYEELQERRKFFSPKELIPGLKHGKRFEPEEREKYEKMARERGRVGGRGGRVVGGGLVGGEGVGERAGENGGERVVRDDGRMQFLQELRNKISK